MVGERKHGLGVASLVLGILSIISFYIIITGIVFGTVGIVLAARQLKQDPTGAAKAGLTTSIIGLSLSVLLIVFAFMAEYM